MVRFKLIAGLVLLVYCPILTSTTNERAFTQPGKSSLTLVNDSSLVSCHDKSGDIAEALKQFSSGQYAPIEQARKVLLSYAKRSSSCRKTVVQAVMAEMDKPNLDFQKQISDYYIWREGSQLLGELKGTEALDLLISHLNLTNGFHSFSMVFQPAILGVRQMGQPAVPKLTVALLQNPNAGIRKAAVYCLTEIGGVSAMHGLEQARRSENDRCVARFINISLSTFSYKSKGRILFDDAAPQANLAARNEWLSSFECVD